MYLIVGGEAVDDDFYKKFNNVVNEIYNVPTLKRSIGIHDYKSLISIIKLIKKIKPDLIHTHSTKPGIVGRLAGVLSGCKTVHTIHGISFHKAQSKTRRVIYFGIEFIPTILGDRLTLVNRYYKKYYRFISKSRVSVIYNGVNTEDKKIDRSVNIENKIKLGFVGRLEYQKNPLFLVDICKELKSRGVDFSLDIYGDGSLKEELDAKFKESDLISFVSFRGWQSDKDCIFSSFDILVAPSRFEAFGLIFVEAACYGLPSVASKVEGIPEVVNDGINGELVEDFCEKDYVDRILKLSNNYLIYQKNLFIMLSKFSLDNMNRKYVKLYEDVLNEG